MDQLDKIQSKLEEHSILLAEIKKDVAYHIKRSDTFEAQVDELRKFMWKIIGAITVVGPILSAGVSWLAKRL